MKYGFLGLAIICQIGVIGGMALNDPKIAIFDAVYAIWAAIEAGKEWKS